MPKRPLKYWLPWIAVLAVGGILRLELIPRLGTLWFDEAFSWRFARMPIGRLLDLLRFDVHPPLHTLVLHYWMLIFGDGVYAVRALSFVTAVAGLVVFLLLGKMLFGRRPAFLALLLAALSPLMVYYGADGRMYAAVFFLSCLSALLFWRMLNGEEDLKTPWFAATLALALTHVTGILVVFAQGAFLLRTPHRRATLKKLLPGFFLISLVFALWLVPAALSRLGTVGGEWQFRASQNAPNAIQSLVYWLWLTENKTELTIIFFFVALCLFAGLLRDSDRRPYVRMTEESEFLFWWFGWTFAPFLFVAAAAPRYLVAAIPPFFLLLADGFLKAGRNRTYALVLGSAAVVFFSSTGLLVQLASRSYNWDRDVDWIAGHYRPGDRIVFGWFADKMAFDATQAAPFNRDLSGFDTRGFYPFDDQLNEDQRLVAHAGTLAIRKKDFDRLGPLFDGAQRIFFIPNYDWTLVEGGSSSDALNAWLRSHGWYLADKRDIEGRTQGVWLLVQKK